MKMSAKENLANAFGTLMAGVIGIICFVYIPIEIVNSKSHRFIASIGDFRLIGPAFISVGVISYLTCCWNFIFDAQGIPMVEGMQKYLIVKGLYKYVRNPIYISWGLIIFGEAIYFQSLDLLLYFLGWIIIFQIRVVFCEEPYLRVKFGASYELYRQSVRRWIPRLKAYKIETNHHILLVIILIVWIACLSGMSAASSETVKPIDWGNVEVLDLKTAGLIALAENPDLAAVQERVLQAREQVVQAKSAYYPSLDAAGAVARVDQSENALQAIQAPGTTNPDRIL